MPTKQVRAFLIMTIAIAASVPLAGCTTSAQSNITAEENSLVTAGFHTIPADTPARQNALNNFPNRIVKRTRGTNVRYAYGDPVVCRCLYVGDRTAFLRYQRTLAKNEAAANTDADEYEGPPFDSWGMI